MSDKIIYFCKPTLINEFKESFKEYEFNIISKDIIEQLETIVIDNEKLFDLNPDWIILKNEKQ